MKLQQLRYALEVYRHNLNVSEAAEALFTSQPGISKQIRLLEEELGIQIFIRSGKRVVSVSQPGKAVLDISERIMRDVQNIKNIGSEFTDHDSGTLTIATSHTQARYALPQIVAEFVKRYPKVRLTIKQGSPSAIAQMVSTGEADMAVITEKIDDHPELSKLPCGEWNYAVIVPQNHPLLDCKNPLSIEDLASFPLITYEFAFNEGSSIARAFAKARLPQPEVALSAADTDVLKTYVKLGLGVGVMAKMAYDTRQDQDLQLVDASHLFEPSPIWIALRSDTYLRGYTYDFIELFAPQLNREAVDRLLYAPIVEDFSI
ncbi:CysB family HTH-type transcriptional regulator [Neisseria perflava]|uniref:CysB family HTH-type transcriptional regulator n=1 Tax=Neisseria perflava TaxID=33053 RepID=UPI00209EB7EB|nr:CysB family HTH-type transcriptional regulator [Neisseria perflava]MCP1659798.1 LysR family cys regulon transcriptional activator [Neisseria perflava]MCP1771603.1 LysR family cys regulon transcriptional activator [Neisseria perflava]